MIVRSKLWVLILPVLILFSCEEENLILQSEVKFAIEKVGIPELLSSTSPRPVLITALVTHPQGSDGIAEVNLEIRDLANQPVLFREMLDDGNVENRGSGDVIAFDQVYSVTLVGNQLGLADGGYRISVRARSTSGDLAESTAQSVDIFPNQPPQILSVYFPDSLPAGFAAREALITVADNDGLNDIRWVILQGFEAGNVFPAFRDTVFNPYNNSPVFILEMDSSYAAAKKGDYEIRFFAEDRIGDFSPAVIRPVYIDNTPPRLLGISVPDTMVIPVSGTTIDTVRAAVTDRQSLRDIGSVYFISQIRRPDGTLGPAGNPIELFDNGDLPGTGDRIAADGEYSRIISLGSSNTPGTYIFTFRAEDQVNQRSEVMVDSIQVIRN